MPSSEEVTRLHEILPKSLADFIELKGYCSFHDGEFMMCSPDEMRPILALVFGADAQFNHNDCQAVGHNAFGELVVWSNEIHEFGVLLPDGEMFAPALTRSDWAPKISLDRSAARVIPDRESIEFFDYFGEPMYDRCVAMHGPLEPGECYGFFPALAFVGTESPLRRVENIRRVKALEHFAILAQLQAFHLMQLVPGGIAPVRPIG